MSQQDEMFIKTAQKTEEKKDLLEDIAHRISAGFYDRVGIKTRVKEVLKEYEVRKI